jgi:quinoprotein glucose dehydrogenase
VTAEGDWDAYEGSSTAAHYSPLKQVDRHNVAKLEPVWSYPIGEMAITSNPLIVDGVMYAVARQADIVALDAATGEELWKLPNAVSFRSRGLAHWRSTDGTESRLLFTSGDRLFAADAKTGKRISGFEVDLRLGLDREPSSIPMIESGTPGKVFGDLLIVGSSTGEDYGAPPGDIRAYDIRSGKLAWIFHTVPRPGEYGYESFPPGAWKQAGGNNDWGGLSLDEKRGIVYVVTGSPTYDFWGGDRKGDNLFGNCIIALDAHTGKRLWHFQTVHHDLWDYDISASPVLLTVRHNGKRIDAVAAAGKTGFLYVFDRVSGKPLWPIEERAVPPSKMPGEYSSPTQPFPTKLRPFVKQHFTVEDIDPNLPAEERAAIVARVKAAGGGNIFDPPETREMVEMPGHRGGANYGMAAANPDTGMAFVAGQNFPVISKLEFGQPLPLELAGTPYEQGRFNYQFMCANCHGADKMGHPPGIPALVEAVQRLGPAKVFETVQHGRGPMPAFADIHGKTMAALIVYLAGDPQGTMAPATDFEVAAETANEPAAPPRWHSSYGFWFTNAGNPVVKPPWAMVTAYDLNHGRIKWQVPLGEDPDYNQRGIFGTGLAFSQPGLAVTGGGLVFASTSRDRKLRALDSDTGRVLWQADLPAPAQGQPSVYAVKGRQFIVVPATGNGSLKIAGMAGDKPGGNSYVAFALPKTTPNQQHP